MKRKKFFDIWFTRRKKFWVNDYIPTKVIKYEDNNEDIKTKRTR